MYGTKNKGFTLIELIIVIVILAVLASIAIPNVGEYINKTKTTSAIADANQLAAALNIYNSTLDIPLDAVPTGTSISTVQTDLTDLSIMPKMKGAFTTVLNNIEYDITTKLFLAKNIPINLTGY